MQTKGYCLSSMILLELGYHTAHIHNIVLGTHVSGVLSCFFFFCGVWILPVSCQWGKETLFSKNFIFPWSLVQWFFLSVKMSVHTKGLCGVFFALFIHGALQSAVQSFHIDRIIPSTSVSVKAFYHSFW